ncbi:MAG: aminoglycoside phosphotransferase [Rhodobacteraceae bacterium CG17_big_fil_post_rev_8_21_14_2_50_63_15]|nr:MAG: aminoglycoside phosphotransferase [Rhodobacteraceae bacterium CG17_big_fil_post_rev_8_21_14_2_50_63_15]
MPDRSTALQTFLAGTDWAGAGMTDLAGDASNRRYLRLRRQETGETAVLMDAPTERGEDVRPFVRIARYLTGLGLSAPHILAKDAQHGFLILEDLGDALFARVIRDAPEMEEPLYAAATDVLAGLHRHAPPSGLDAYAPPLMADLAALAFDWYLAGVTGAQSPHRAAFHTALNDTLADLSNTADVLIQRDYHAENLLWLPKRTGLARVGLLDFQDAMLGHRAYDLVSILQDARRDVPPAIETAMIDRYIATTGVATKDFLTAYHCLGAQRNLRILGVFARLCLRDGKVGYVDLIPRVWAHLAHDLAHPAMARVADILDGVLPGPDPDILQGLKDQCRP